MTNEKGAPRVAPASEQPQATAHASSGHWPSTKFAEHVLLDALVKHVLGLMTYGMSDLGEVLEVVNQLKGTDEESWVESWARMGKRLQERAEAADRAGKKVSASTAYLRASTYWRVSLMYFSQPDDARMKTYARASTKCYERYLELSGYPGRAVEIPYEGASLPGHFYKSPVAREKAPLLIVTPGRDTWAEDTRWVYDAAIRRGIHCLVYDGPGQGFALRLKDLRFRHDWENVVGPVIDFALTMPGVDPSRIALMGMSFGGALSVRAAAFERRLKVLIADPGTLSWGEAIAGHFRRAGDAPLDALPPEMRNMLRDYAWKQGVPNSAKDVAQALAAYDNSAVASQIACETLVIDGTEEMVKGQAQKLFDALQCPKHFMLFDETSTAQAHCQIGGYATATERIFDWLDERL